MALRFRINMYQIKVLSKNIKNDKFRNNYLLHITMESFIAYPIWVQREAMIISLTPFLNLLPISHHLNIFLCRRFYCFCFTIIILFNVHLLHSHGGAVHHEAVHWRLRPHSGEDLHFPYRDRQRDGLFRHIGYRRTARCEYLSILHSTGSRSRIWNF